MYTVNNYSQEYWYLISDVGLGFFLDPSILDDSRCIVFHNPPKKLYSSLTDFHHNCTLFRVDIRLNYQGTKHNIVIRDVTVLRWFGIIYLTFVFTSHDVRFSRSNYQRILHI